MKKETQERPPEIVTMRQLLECGVHFGHQTKRWNPKMKKYIFTSRNGIHVIDLQQTIKLIRKVYEVVKDGARKGGSVLFVGTKKQAQEAVQAEAERCGMAYVNHRWLGGTLTNNITIRQSINKLKDINKLKEDGILDQLSNKEASRKNKMLTRLEYYLNGIRDMTTMPSFVFIIDTKREQLAVREANRLGIPIIGAVDTNADPNEVQFPIPANDDAIRAIKLLCSIIAQAVLDGQRERAENVVAEAERAQALAHAEANPVEVTTETLLDIEVAPVLEYEEIEKTVIEEKHKLKKAIKKETLDEEKVVTKKIVKEKVATIKE
ncbi:MAG: 30S ribosomal protein S2 [Candidatus Margulisbacteria bacterium]|nr:30S ribosomal protein S2 [Candidatus Margulisiibacteriota bacterium]